MISKNTAATAFSLGLAALAAALTLPIIVTSIISILLVLIWVVEGNWQFKWQMLKQNIWLKLYLGFYLLHVLGLFYTQNLDAGLFDLEKKLALFILPLLVASSYTLDKVHNLRHRVHTWFIASCFLTLLFCIGHGLYRYQAGIPPTLSVYGSFEATQQFKADNAGISNIWEYITYSELLSPINLHPTYAAMFLLLAISILLERVLKRTLYLRSNLLYLHLLLITFFTASIFLLASRIAIIIYIVLLPLQLGWHVRHYFTWRSITAGCAGFLLILVVLLNFVPVVKHRFSNEVKLADLAYNSDKPGTGMMMRLALWKSASQVIVNHAAVGVGTGDIEEELNTKYEANNIASLVGYNTHNQYLQTGVMLGLIGLIYLLLLLLLPLTIAWRRNDIIYLIFLFIIGVSFLTESALQTNKGIVFYALFNSVYMFRFNQAFHKD